MLLNKSLLENFETVWKMYTYFFFYIKKTPKQTGLIRDK